MTKQTNNELREVLHDSLTRVSYVAGTLNLMGERVGEDLEAAQKASGTLLLLEEELRRVGTQLDEAWLRLGRGEQQEEAQA